MTSHETSRRTHVTVHAGIHFVGGFGVMGTMGVRAVAAVDGVLDFVHDVGHDEKLLLVRVVY